MTDSNVAIQGRLRAVWLRLAATVESLPPETIALLAAVGLVLGTFPVYGLPTILCAFASLVLRLSIPALQVINQLTSPLQFIMLIPFARLGARFVASPVGLHASMASRLGASAVQAIAGWSLVSIPLGVLVYFTMMYALRRRVQPATSSSGIA